LEQLRTIILTEHDIFAISKTLVWTALWDTVAFF